jgi:hypothetical protein
VPADPLVGVLPYWGQVGHYSIATFAREALPEGKLKDFMAAHVARSTWAAPANRSAARRSPQPSSLPAAMPESTSAIAEPPRPSLSVAIQKLGQNLYFRWRTFWHVPCSSERRSR